VIDFATLTGAARVALGPDLPALFTRRDETAEEMLAAGIAHDDPLLAPAAVRWVPRIPEKRHVADINNSGSNGFAGATVGGLFLDRFVPEGIDWAHFDTFAWRPAAKPGRPRAATRWACARPGHMLKGRYG
jgi:leucyl aminopeptidase